MRILLITQWYPPEPVGYISDLTESFLREGHSVSVLTAFPNWPYGKIYKGYSQSFSFSEELNGIRVQRAPLYPDHSASGFGRVFNYITFSAFSTFVGLSYLQRHDIVLMLTPSMSVFPPGAILSKKWKVPLVLNIQDMWPEALAASGLIKSSHLLKIVSAVCNFAYRRSKKIAVISRGFKDNLVEKGVREEKVVVIPNTVDVEKYSPIVANADLTQKLGMYGKFNFLYAGTMGPSQHLDTVLSAAAELRGHPHLQINLVGDGNDVGKLKEKARRLALNNVKFLGRYPEKEIQNILALADVLFLHLKDEPILRITVPHKTLVYMAMGKPVLAAVDGETAEIVTNADAGVSCRPNDPEDLAKKMLAMSRMSRKKLDEMGENGRRTACKKYSKSIVAKQYLSVFNTVVNEHEKFR